MVGHMLVPLDGSPLAEQALPVAARIARFTGGSLLLVRVVSPPVDYSGGWYLVSQEGIDEEMSSATAYLRALTTSPGLAGLEIRTRVVFGQPVLQLLAQAGTPGIDLLVLCSHGRTGFTRWMLGSVAHALVHQCPLPILVLGQGEIPSALAPLAAAGSFRTLVPLDGSPLAEAALGPAAQVTAALAPVGQGVLHLSQVVKNATTAAEWGVSETDEEALQRARTYLNKAEERLSVENRDLQLSLTSSALLASDVASALLNLAEHGKVGETSEGPRDSNPCDLIAISTHGHGGLERWVMGSVTERLLNTTTLPMLIVRPPKEE